MTTVEQLLDEGEEQIRSSRFVDLWRPSDARVNAEELLGEVLGKEIDSDDLDLQVKPPDARKYRSLVKRRSKGEPVALILGYTEFRGLRIELRKGVFVPRNSSELLAEKVIQKIRRRKDPVAVDVATGIGPVAMAAAKEVPAAKVFGLDIWAPSIRLATENAKRLKIRNVQFIRSDMLSKLPDQVRGRVDTFSIHPPYVARRYVKTLPDEIRGFEPRVSLTDESIDGLGLVRRLAKDAPDWLRPGGWVLVEVSPDLSRRVKSILHHAGFKDLKSERDSLGATRVVSGRIA